MHHLLINDLSRHHHHYHQSFISNMLKSTTWILFCRLFYPRTKSEFCSIIPSYPTTNTWTSNTSWDLSLLFSFMSFSACPFSWGVTNIHKKTFSHLHSCWLTWMSTLSQMSLFLIYHLKCFKFAPFFFVCVCVIIWDIRHPAHQLSNKNMRLTTNERSPFSTN